MRAVDTAQLVWSGCSGGDGSDRTVSPRPSQMWQREGAEKSSEPLIRFVGAGVGEGAVVSTR